MPDQAGVFLLNTRELERIWVALQKDANKVLDRDLTFQYTEEQIASVLSYLKFSSLFLCF